MSRQVPFAAPLIGAAEIEAVTAVLRSGWIGTGAVTADTEQRFADYLGAPHVLLLNSGTAALHLALLALGIGPGDEVIVPTVTFTATAATVLHAGAVPVLVDVEPDTLRIDVEAVRRALTPRTRAVVAVHFAGRMADVRALRSLCDAHGLRLIEDSAHALPAERDGTVPGGIADAAAFSFFVTKPLTSAEGGLLTMADGDAAARARVLSAHGIDRDAFARHSFGRSPHYDVVAPGLKYNMPDTASALLRCQLDQADAMRARRRDIATAYLAALADLPGLRLPPVDTPTDTSSWYLFVVQLGDGLDRDAVAAELHRHGVGTSVHFRPLHQFSYYRTEVASAAGEFPVADDAFTRVLSLPIFPGMSDEDIEHVATAVRAVLEQAVGR
ncbi:dTDP-4-amino-4,6-dideoxygalactose transaminase [Allocatelliglobosispora scoriae]|uniref:dTDP-4-amino-4,6-dideoxygalactose transaminase n=1 Tax=Allocatelliglobosispora scoriae TaxID=643052 RepID=A0A841BL11_9ACTN|nr:DegT/DnrJ/EryC1/StrS aminotransferase family protein [Allocatelliglobosispora scoriae]MBB5868325.1 dTDP-4-amino-4,6-dideoxygalactose transaminase [Allocatelliglobosispora scoriae]